MTINKNMLRDRAEKLEDVSDESWKLINKDNKELVEEFLSINKQLSKETLKQYTSGLRQFFWWVHLNLNDKPFYKISKRDFLKYTGFLIDRGLSSSAIGFKKSAVSSFCNYIENIVADEMEECKNFRNFTRGLPSIAKNQVYEKVAISEDEYKLIMSVLEENGDYLAMAWVATAFNVGARRAELIQFKTELIDYPLNGKNYIVSHMVRGKGKSVDGKPLQYMINEEALKYMRLWVEKRDFESDFIFAIKKGESSKPIGIDWANNLCQNKLSNIVGRRITVHNFKASCITHLLEKGVDMKVVSKYVAQHNDVSTTSSFYDLREFDEEKDKIFDMGEKEKK
jgi:site-specific recombinase XerD